MVRVSNHSKNSFIELWNWNYSNNDHSILQQQVNKYCRILAMVNSSIVHCNKISFWYEKYFMICWIIYCEPNTKIIVVYAIKYLTASRLYVHMANYTCFYHMLVHIQLEIQWKFVFFFVSTENMPNQIPRFSWFSNWPD